MSQRFAWGHININVSNLEASIAFYEKLGFSVFIPSIPYLGVARDSAQPMHAGSASALGLAEGTAARACIMQLDDRFPKIDLTELANVEQREPLGNTDQGLVRICLVSENLAGDYEHLVSEGVTFLTPPQPCHERLATVATCQDPDGTLIELLQVDLARWAPFL